MRTDLDARKDYADDILDLSLHIIGAVHDRTSTPTELAAAIDRALIEEAPAGIDPVHALVTILAAQINPDTTTLYRLALFPDLVDAEQAA